MTSGDQKLPRCVGTTSVIHFGGSGNTAGPRSQVTRSFDHNDATPRPVAKTQYSSRCLTEVEGSCAPRWRLLRLTGGSPCLVRDFSCPQDTDPEHYKQTACSHSMRSIRLMVRSRDTRHRGAFG